MWQTARFRKGQERKKLGVAVWNQYLHDTSSAAEDPSWEAPQMTLLMALAVADGIRKVTGLSTQIKWPNDIILNGKKICGILTEMSAEIDYINYVVVGVGINCNQETFPEELREKATSLKLESGQEIQRAAVIAAVMGSLELTIRF